MRKTPSLFKPVALAALAVVSMTSAVQAQDLYGRVFLGGSDLNNPLFSGDVAGAPATVSVESDDGLSFGIAVGRTFGRTSFGSIRGEIELSRTTNDASEVFFSGNSPAAEVNVGGGIDATRLFANAYLDFDTGTRVTPYVGAGLGVARSSFDLVYGPGVVLSDSSTDLSAQLIAGGAYAVNDRLSVTADVRYIRDFGVATNRLSPTGALTGVVEDDIDTVSVNVGLQFKF